MFVSLQNNRHLGMVSLLCNLNMKFYNPCNDSCIASCPFSNRCDENTVRNFLLSNLKLQAVGEMGRYEVGAQL